MVESNQTAPRSYDDQFEVPVYRWDGEITNKRVRADQAIVMGSDELRVRDTGMQGRTEADYMNAYYGSVGVEINNDMEIEEILKKANLEWDLLSVDTPPRNSPVPGFYTDDKGVERRQEDPEWEYLNPRSIPRTVYRINPETGRKIYFGTVTTGWNPYQNKQVLEVAQRFAKLGNVNMERCGMFKKGQTVWVLTDINETFELSGSDRVSGKVIMTDVRDGNTGFASRVMVERQVCGNGLVLPVELRRMTFSHLKEFNIEEVAERLLLVRNEFRAFENQARIMSTTNLEDKKMDQALRTALIVDLIGNPKAKSLEEQPELVKSLIADMQYGIAEAIIMAGVRKTQKIDLALPAEAQPEIVQEILSLYLGQGMGSNLTSSYNTPWGVFNALTEYQNHRVRGTYESRFNSLLNGGSYNVQRAGLSAANKVAVALSLS